MAAFILMVSLSIGTSFLLYRQTKHSFSVLFLVILLTLFCLTKKRIQKIEVESLRALSSQSM
jgi:hypothetical protein